MEEKLLFIVLTVFFSLNLHADTYLEVGASRWVSSGIVHCGGSQPSEKRFNCSYVACFKSSSVHHTSQHNCEFFKGYESSSDSVWALSGSEAESKLEREVSSDSDIVHLKTRSISCY